MDRFIEIHKFQLGPHIAENVVPSLRAGIQQQLRAYGGRHNGETDRENRASLDRLERTTKDVCFLVSILQVREQVVSFYVSFPESALNASIALIVSIPRHASMDGLSLLSSSGRDH